MEEVQRFCAFLEGETAAIANGPASFLSEGGKSE